MNFQIVLTIVSFITASLILVVGIAILTGFLVPSYVPSDYRVISGVVMLLYGSYRIVMVWLKQRHAKTLEE